ncbi:hypothetical protein RM445_26755 [Pseudonocardia sp. DSM 45834]|uniref:AAA ATPase domain-containing protein n=1 Tax=Pseudonocardia charpentierae TaxID=3075545 RepID=A0ABU2NGM5_9PSEU|nr:hypothetical protein [Pseudonocardia sp. DSM 45834]MDT0353118.1 hypothetical protein [Pseudonocardia sp. DSM 45834]
MNAGSFSAMLHSTDHQILYGRRGTGKTHALQHLSDLVERTGDVSIYVDLRTIGSTGGTYAIGDMSASIRGTQLLVDVLETIHDELFAFALEQADDLLQSLDALAEAATTVEVVGEVERETTVGDTRQSKFGLELSGGPSAKLTSEDNTSTSAQSRLRRTGIEQLHIVFGPLNRALRAISRALGTRRLWLLLDEWSSIPLDLQPLLADLLRRSVLPVSKITVKIAAIERRCRFSIPTAPGDYVGIELGADAATAVSLDDAMVFSDEGKGAQDFFAQLFYNHSHAMLRRLVDPPCDAAQFISEAFRGDAFLELVRAAEGVPRDAINIAALAAQLAHEDPVEPLHIRRAARDWYLRDKQAAIDSDEEARIILSKLVNEVVGKRRSRTFLLEHTTSAAHQVIDTLYDARLLHVLRRGIVDREQPGTLYDGFAIDYGCYVALMLDGKLQCRPRHRVGWLNSVHAVPPDGFDFHKEAIDLNTLN